MNYVKIKVGDAIGDALNWLVAKCEGKTTIYQMRLGAQGRIVTEDQPDYIEMWKKGGKRYSTDWSAGGPIIDREMEKGMRMHYTVAYYADADEHGPYEWSKYAGPTLLVAVMRSYVASKLGDEVEVPEGLGN